MFFGEKRKKIKINRGKCKVFSLPPSCDGGKNHKKNIEKFDLQIIRKELTRKETEKLSIDLKATALRKLT